MNSHCTPPVEKTNAFSSFRTPFIIAACIIPVILVFLSFDYGITWDEWIQNHYGRLILRYFMSWGQSKDCLTEIQSQYLYGGLFDTLCNAIYALIFFFGKISTYVQYSFNFDIVLPHLFDTRHVINALFGFAAILWTGLLTRKVAGWRAGLIALLLLFLSPRFFGNSMNNPKDIPFAAAYIFSIYYLVSFLLELPKPRLRTALFLALGIALSINIKIGGILILTYLYFLTAVLTGWALLRKNKIHWAYTGGLLFLITVTGYLGGMLFWPYGLENPIKNPILALNTLSQFTSAQGSLLFDGRQIPYDQTPWYYLPKWILISTPFSVLTGLGLFAVTVTGVIKKISFKSTAAIAFSAGFPLFYIIYKKSVVYDSWRHVLFVYPLFVILAALGWEYCLRILKNKAHALAAGALLGLQLFFPLGWMVLNHPHEYIYFNSLTGGLHGAFGKYETDYWGNSLRAGTEWLATDYLKSGAEKPIIIRSDGELISSAYYLVKLLGNRYIPYSPSRPDQWDYYISLPRGISPEKLLGGEWPPQGTVHTIDADGVPLCAIVKNKKIPS